MDFKRFMTPFCSAGAAGAGRQSHQGPFNHPFHDHDRSHHDDKAIPWTALTSERSKNLKHNQKQITRFAMNFKRFMDPLCSAGAAGAGRQTHQGPFIHPFHDHDDMSLYILSMLLKLSKLLCYSRIAKTSKVCTIFERQPSLLQPSKAEYQVVKAITLFSETYVYYDNTGCRVFKRGVQNQKDFCLRINILKGNY